MTRTLIENFIHLAQNSVTLSWCRWKSEEQGNGKHFDARFNKDVCSIPQVMLDAHLFVSSSRGSFLSRSASKPAEWRLAGHCNGIIQWHRMCYCSARLADAFPPHDVHYTSFTVSHLICEQSRERVQPTDVNCLARWTRLRFHNFLCFLRRRSRMTLRFIFGGYMCAELSNRWETIVSRWSREEKLKMTKTLFQLVCLRRFYSFFAGH